MMKTDILLTVRVFLVVVIGEILHYVAADSEQGGSNSYYYNTNYNENNKNQDSNYKYNYGNELEPADYGTYPATISCFACMLSHREGHTQGLEHCDDPFDRLDVPAVDCKGACGKVYHQHSATDFLITRGCVPGCKEHRDDKSYTQCCTKPYCNTAKSWHSYHLGLFTLCVVLTLWISRW